MSRVECVSLLQDCLAVQLQRVGPTGAGPPSQSLSQYWMYDSGYLLFQGFLEANLKCFWDRSLVAAVRSLEYRGYICPGVLLLGGSSPALHLLRAAWSRNVLKPPPNYNILLLGDVEECVVSKIRPGGFTPLPDAICWVVLQLGASGQSAVIETIKSGLASSFPNMEIPAAHVLYDTLADLMTENKVYQTAHGYFIATPDSARLSEGRGGRSLLMSPAEAIAVLHGEMHTIREGSRTHQAIQTNLADVICGGNKQDKILYPRVYNKHQARKLERRHSMRLLGSSRKLSTLHRAGSVRLLQQSNAENMTKKCSLLSRLFRWSKRHPVATTPSSSFSPDFPPQEWFNSTVLHLQSVGTQTHTPTKTESDWSASMSTLRDRRRSLSTSRLPRRQSRAPSESPKRQSRAPSVSPSRPSTPSSSKTVLCNNKAMSSASSGYNSLPRSSKSKLRTSASSSAQSTPKSSPQHLSKNSIKVEVSANSSPEHKVDTRMTINDPSATMMTTINGPNSTKIYVQQQNSPMRSVITFENRRKTSLTKDNSISKEEKDRTNKTDVKKSKRPSSLYQETSKDLFEKKKEFMGQLDNNVKMKFPSTETIQMEEKLLAGNKNNKNLCQKKNLFNPTNSEFKAGSLIDVAALETEMNNVRKASFSLSPLQPSVSNDKVLESISFKNILKETQLDSPVKRDDKNVSLNAVKSSSIISKLNEVQGKQIEGDGCTFPSLSDLSIHFTSIAAQNILKGVSVNSIDTLVEVNMAAEKHNKDVGIHTDLGVV